MTPSELADEIARLAEKATPGPWSACKDGECSCRNVWAPDHPIAKFESGPWGDTFPSIRVVGDSDMDAKAEAFIERIEYGAVDPECSKNNVRLVVSLVNAIPQILSALRAADAVEGAKVALGNVVTAYAKANPLRRADFHPAECACQRCAVDHAKSALTHLEGLK